MGEAQRSRALKAHWTERLQLKGGDEVECV